MKLTQSWVGYLDRSYQQVKSSILARLVISNPEITDHNESNLLILLISMFAGIAEMLNYYIDMMGREGFLGTAQRFTSVIQLAQLIDYNARANIAATVNLLFTLSSGGNPYYTTSTITIPSGTKVQDNNGNTFNTLQEVQIVPGQAAAFSSAQNYTNLSGVNIGTTNGQALQQIQLDPLIVDGSLSVIIDNVPWQLYSSAGLMTSTTMGFIVAVLADGNCYMIFGDGVNGMIPQTNQQIIGTYQQCAGSDANDPPNTITNLISTGFTLPAGVSIAVTNPDYASNGANFETIDDVKNFAPRSIRTLQRAVTYQDYIDVAILCPGVGDAAVSYCCGKYVSVYIIPSTQGTATPALVANVLNWFATRKMLTTQVSIIPAGISQLFMTATIYANPLYSANQALIAVIGLLYSKYAYGNATINGQPSVSSILALMESDPSVDHVDIDSVQVLPNVQPIQGNTSPLVISFQNLPTTGTPYTYTIVFSQASSQFYIYQGSVPKGSVGLNQMYSDNVLAFTIGSANYADGAQWQFIAVASYPQTFPSTVIDITDFSVPIFNIGPVVDANTPQTIYSNLTVVTQGVASNALPPCQ